MDRFKALAATADEGAVLRCAVEVANDALVVATNSAWGKSRDLDCLEKVVWILSSAQSGTEIPPEYAESAYIDAAALAVQAEQAGETSVGGAVRALAQLAGVATNAESDGTEHKRVTYLLGAVQILTDTVPTSARAESISRYSDRLATVESRAQAAAPKEGDVGLDDAIRQIRFVLRRCIAGLPDEGLTAVIAAAEALRHLEGSAEAHEKFRPKQVAGHLSYLAQQADAEDRTELARGLRGVARLVLASAQMDATAKAQLISRVLRDAQGAAGRE